MQINHKKLVVNTGFFRRILVIGLVLAFSVSFLFGNLNVYGVNPTVGDSELVTSSQDLIYTKTSSTTASTTNSVSTLKMMYETQIVNGLNASQLEANPSPSDKSGLVELGRQGFAFWTFYWGVRIWIRSSSGVESELTSGEPVAVVNRNSSSEEYMVVNATWNCPGAEINRNDSVVVRVYCTYNSSLWEHIVGNFTTEQLGATQLGSATWTIYYDTHCSVFYDSIYIPPQNSYYGGFKYGYILSSHIENFQLTSPSTTVDAPVFSLSGGAYTSSQSVTLSCSISGATIRYTTDGSEPSTLSTEYARPILVSSNTTIKAKAFMTGMSDSNTVMATYTFNSSSSGEGSSGNSFSGDSWLIIAIVGVVVGMAAIITSAIIIKKKTQTTKTITHY